MKFFAISISILFIFTQYLSAAILIGPVNTQSDTKNMAWKSVHEPEVSDDFLYEDNKIIIWFDRSSGGFPRGIWIKNKNGVLTSKNTKGEIVPTNLIFGGGYQILASSVSRPDSPTENFMIFGEQNPRPALTGNTYFKEGKVYTELGFIGWMYNTVIKTADGFDPNINEIKPEHYEPNIYTNDSWDKDKVYWVHTSTDPITHKMNYTKVKGNGVKSRIAYRAKYKIYHNAMKFDSDADIFFYNKPKLSTLLLLLDTFHGNVVNGSDYAKSLGHTGLNSARWNVASYDNWLGIPPEKVIRKEFKKDEISTVKHVEIEGYPGNGATSFVVWKKDLREPWIEFFNGNTVNETKSQKGINTVIRRDWRNIEACSHFGFTSTPWYDGPQLGYWWVTNEVAIDTSTISKDIEIRSFSETISFRSRDK